jgi:hypothetical protein
MADGGLILRLFRGHQGCGQDQNARQGKGGGSANTAEQLIIALGYAQDRRAVPALVELAAQKGPLSAVSEALGRIGDPAGAAPLAEYLATRSQRKPNPRNDLVVACALWRCGDRDDLAKSTLESFVGGDNSLYAHLARKLLNAPPKRPVAAPQ